MTPDEPSVSPSDEETPGPVSTAVCLGERAYNPDSAPYAGKGPHPMTIIHHEAEESCPSGATDSGSPQIAQAVNDDAVAAKLRSLYEEPARKT
ncbi:hypothetical protein ACWGLG_24565 [Streptomyces antimycoticus]